MSESVPSSVTGFAHRRPRADSIASFTYFQEDDELPEWSEDVATVDEDDGGDDIGKLPEDELDYDLESGSILPRRRISEGFSRVSAQDSLLHRHDSTKTDASGTGPGARTTQKIYVLTEDLTIVVAGFGTDLIGLFVYFAICTLSGGLGYLVLRWLPSWRVRLMGFSKPLEECDWVVIEVRALSLQRR